jgi:signal transduction histidine kinase
MSTDNYEQLLQFLYRVPVGLLEVDAQGEVRLMNAYATRVLMPIAGAVRAPNLFEILGPYAPRLAESLAEYQGRHGTILSNHRVYLPEGSGAAGWYAFTLERLAEDSYMVAFRDVTDEVEREERLNEATSQEAEQRGRMEIAGSVLHDIGNAVAGLSTKVSRLLGEPTWRELTELKRLSELIRGEGESLGRALGPERRDALETFLAELIASLETRSDELRGTASEMAQTLEHVSETLSLQRQYAEEWVSGSRAAVNLLRLLEDAIAMQRSGFEKRGVELTRAYPEEPVRVDGDRTKLVRVFVNLLKNALESFDEADAPGEHRPHIHVAVEPGEAGDAVRIAVSDTGAGFLTVPASLEGEERDTAKPGGSGMGLYAARRIVEAHGGTLSLSSDGPGTGAAAVVTLPLQRNPKASQGSSGESE